MMPIQNFRPRRRAQHGVAAVEFALTALFFFTFMVGMLEISRAMYLWNTVGEMTRRYARQLAVTDFNDGAAMALARQTAAFGSAAGTIPMGGNITAANLEMGYLRSDGVTPVGALPDCPEQNIINCSSDPDGANCVRFVRVRLCASDSGDGACALAPYVSMLKLEGLFPKGTFHFPTFTTLVPVDAFGHKPGVSDSCP